MKKIDKAILLLESITVDKPFTLLEDLEDRFNSKIVDNVIYFIQILIVVTFFVSAISWIFFTSSIYAIVGTLLFPSICIYLMYAIILSDKAEDIRCKEFYETLDQVKEKLDNVKKELSDD